VSKKQFLLTSSKSNSIWLLVSAAWEARWCRRPPHFGSRLLSATGGQCQGTSRAQLACCPGATCREPTCRVASELRTRPPNPSHTLLGNPPTALHSLLRPPRGLREACSFMAWTTAGLPSSCVAKLTLSGLEHQTQKIQYMTRMFYRKSGKLES
jgi:hypothetical protein